jgi:hypothetical protein
VSESEAVSCPTWLGWLGRCRDRGDLFDTVRHARRDGCSVAAIARAASITEASVRAILTDDPALLPTLERLRSEGWAEVG